MEIASVYKCMFDGLRERSVDKLIELASNLLEMPIVLTDATFVVLSKYPVSLFGDEQWDANVVGHQIRPEYIKVFQQDEHWDAFITQNADAILVNWGFFAQSPRYSAQIISQGKIIGYVAALLREAQPEDCHLDAMEILADALSVAMETQYRSKHGSDIMAGVMLQGLLLNEFEDAEEINRLCAITGDAIEPNYVLAAVKTRKPQYFPLEEYFSKAFTANYKNALRVVQNDCLYVLFTGIDVDFKEKSYFKEAVHQCKVAESICAFSRVFSKLPPITDYKWQVDKLLEVGSLLRPDKTVFHFDNYELYATVATIADEVSQDNMVHPLLHTLAHYDNAHNTEYLETLRVYLLSNYSKAKAAHKLHIHRNTLLYRLGKIEEIAHASLLGGDLGCCLYLSLKYLEMNNICLCDKPSSTQKSSSQKQVEDNRG